MPNTTYQAVFPSALYAGNTQQETAGLTSNPRVQQALDYNIHDEEIKAIQQTVGLVTGTQTVAERLTSVESAASAAVSTANSASSVAASVPSYFGGHALHALGFAVGTGVVSLAENNHIDTYDSYITPEVVGDSITIDTTSAYATGLGVDSRGRITLHATGVYKLEAHLEGKLGSSGSYGMMWRDADTGAQIGNQSYVSTDSGGDLSHRTDANPTLLGLLTVTAAPKRVEVAFRPAPNDATNLTVVDANVFVTRLS